MLTRNIESGKIFGLRKCKPLCFPGTASFWVPELTIKTFLCMNICSTWEMQCPSLHRRERDVYYFNMGVENPEYFKFFMLNDQEISQKTQENQFLLLNHHPSRKCPVCLSLVPQHHRSREPWTCHFAFFPVLGWLASTNSFKPLTPAALPHDFPGSGHLPRLVFWQLSSLYRRWADWPEQEWSFSNLHRRLTGGFVTTQIARPQPRSLI